MPQTLAALLRARRKELGLRQVDVATMFQISQPSYWRWESGEGLPHEDRFEALADHLQTTVEAVEAAVEEGEAIAERSLTAPVPAPEILAELRGIRTAIDEGLDALRSELDLTRAGMESIEIRLRILERLLAPRVNAPSVRETEEAR